MFLRLAKNATNILSKSTPKPTLPTLHIPRAFSSSIQHFESLEKSLVETKQDQIVLNEDVQDTSPHINAYMKELYKYLGAASVIGIASAHIFSIAVPVGVPAAYLILAGFGLEHLGGEYIAKTKQQIFTYKNAEGNIQYGTSNTWPRKLAFLSSCLGYGCIIGSLMGMVPIAPSILPLSAITCLFSTLGHLNYCKFAPKPKFNTTHLFISGLVSGVLGLNLITSGSTLLMWDNPLHLESIEVSSYIGLLLYNLFTGHDSQKAVEDVNAGKGDYLKHANKFAENWLYALIPHFLMNMH